MALVSKDAAVLIEETDLTGERLAQELDRLLSSPQPVSYTHLDVYKRQAQRLRLRHAQRFRLRHAQRLRLRHAQRLRLRHAQRLRLQFRACSVLVCL